MPSVLRDSHGVSLTMKRFIKFSGIVMHGNLDTFKSYRQTCMLRGRFSVSNLLGALTMLLIRHCII